MPEPEPWRTGCTCRTGAKGAEKTDAAECGSAERQTRCFL